VIDSFRLARITRRPVSGSEGGSRACARADVMFVKFRALFPHNQRAIIRSVARQSFKLVERPPAHAAIRGDDGGGGSGGGSGGGMRGTEAHTESNYDVHGNV
jgi:hypothetical protein